MDDARAALEAAGERQRKIDALIADKQKALDALAAERLSIEHTYIIQHIKR